MAALGSEARCVVAAAVARALALGGNYVGGS